MQTNESHAYERDQVIKIINSVISKVEHAEDDSRLQIFSELKNLQTIIEDARSELGAMRPGEINDTHIPTATDELDAIVEATAEATGTIMDACEAIQEKIAGSPNEAAITEEIMKVYEACSFQDITGQRITKVVKTLKDIEGKVSNIIKLLASKIPGMADGKAGDDDGNATGGAGAVMGGAALDKDSVEYEKAHLLNGPQMPDKAISQDDIDKLLAEFD
ncbi:MAG: protein phosphatase CheZ [Bdellovibrionales bacterium]